MSPLGVYIHIPFCAAICGYCNFNRGLLDEPLKARYVDALVAHITREGAREAVDTIYFGGGTPSLLTPGELERILQACRAAWAVRDDAEVTLEANPESVGLEAARAYRAAGVTRVSLGVQSFDDAALRQLGRLHDAAGARRAVEVLRRAGYDNVSLDLMMWLPGQTVESWLASVDQLIAVGPEHASIYLLEVYPNSPLRDEMARAGTSQAPDDVAEAMYLGAFERLEEAGLLQYEISNVARPGRESRHNLKYWTDGDWLAYGCGAHGSVGLRRFRHVAGIADYVERVAAGVATEAETVRQTPAERAADAAFMGLRTREGIDAAAIRARYGVDLWARHGEALAPFVEGGWLVRDGTRLRLTRRGFLVANEIMRVFV
ncbi:MAG: radical SAM family heme chaperone HemW [Vicinamibacteraceae bacterium]|nr:radical SAM family heme chaperone HemW [Vicinamibacteraceae bacterium]